MITPNLEEFNRFFEQGYLSVPVIKKLAGDLDTPVSILKKLMQVSRRVFLLESKEGPEKWARYSFLGYDPEAILEGSNGEAILYGNDERRMEYEDPLDLLKELMSERKSPRIEGLPSFIGGAVGYLGYDNIRYFEPVKLNKPDDLALPEMLFFFTDMVIVVDHWEQSITLVKSVKKSGDIQGAYTRAQESLDQAAALISGPLEQASVSSSGKAFEVSSNMEANAYKELVNKAKGYINAGDIFQVVLSQRFEVEPGVAPVEIYRSLRRLNPSPYLYFLQKDDFCVIGSSPEPLVKVTGDEVITRPIAGTRRRGYTLDEDRALERELLADPKEKAEHIMLVDLGRNDIGRVCVPGTVNVDEFINVERYSHVMHLVSNVRGTLAPDKSSFDALRSAFPAGTVSGAPKIRAMEIIDELEPNRRGPYAGAVVYFSDSGDLDCCITIRTIVVKDKKAYVQAGAGIVADSIPELEYKETENKARALLKAIETAGTEEF